MSDDAETPREEDWLVKFTDDVSRYVDQRALECPNEPSTLIITVDVDTARFGIRMRNSPGPGFEKMLLEAALVRVTTEPPKVTPHGEPPKTDA